MKRGEMFSQFCPLCHLMSHCTGMETHLVNAEREILLALRALIDRELERIGEKPGREKKRARKVELR